MSERQCNVDKSLRIKSCFLLVLTLIFAFLNGCGYYVCDSVENYDDFLNNYEKYGDYNQNIPNDGPNLDIPSEPPQEQPPEQSQEEINPIPGFKAIVNKYFSFGKAFDGKYAIVTENDKNFALEQFGALTEISIIDNSTVNGNFIFGKNGKIGVKNIFGITIIDSIYDEIELLGNSIMAKINKKAAVYSDIGLISEFNYVDHCSLINESYIIADGKIYDLEFNLMKIADYEYADIPGDDNIVMVKLQDNKIGYVDLTSGQRVGDAYEWASSFSDGTAIVRKKDDDNYEIIDTHGDVIHSFSNRIVSDKKDGYYCYLKLGFYGIMDENFIDVTPPIFYSLKYEHAVGGYFVIIRNGKNVLYSPSENNFVSDEYESIEYFDGIFICESESGTVVLDSDLQEIVVCGNAKYNKGILMIESDGKYAYYMREIR